MKQAIYFISFAQKVSIVKRYNSVPKEQIASFIHANEIILILINKEGLDD